MNSSSLPNHRTGRRPAAWRLAAAGTLVAFVLAGCQAGVVEEDTTTPVADAPTQTEEPTEEAPTTQEPATEPATEGASESAEVTEEPADDGEVSGGEASGEVAPPGTEVEVGETVTTHVQTPGVPSDEYYGFATLATTVTTVEAGDPELFESAENAADFAGLTPWFVRVEHEWLTYEGKPNGNMIPTLVAFNESGGELSGVMTSTWSAGIPGCELEMPDEKGVGEKATNCHVVAVPDGESVGSVGWRGDDYADGDGSAMDNPYYDDPVLWLVP